jgi:hypothetical protein
VSVSASVYKRDCGHLVPKPAAATKTDWREGSAARADKPKKQAPQQQMAAASAPSRPPSGARKWWARRRPKHTHTVSPHAPPAAHLQLSPLWQLPSSHERLRVLQCGSFFSGKKEHRACLASSQAPELSGSASPTASCFQGSYVAREHKVCTPLVPRKGNQEYGTGARTFLFKLPLIYLSYQLL